MKLVADDFETVRREERLGLLAICLRRLRSLDALALLHGDPFDRMLIAQALVGNVPIVTADGRFAAHALNLIR